MQMKKVREILFFGALAVTITATFALGQSRKQVYVAGPGQPGISTRVDSSVQVFNSYSAGLGTSVSSSLNPNSVLTNAAVTEFSISRYSNASTGSGPGNGLNISELGRAPGGARLDSGGGNIIQPGRIYSGGQTIPRSVNMDTAILGAAADYLEQIGGIFAGANAKKPITSFVPRQPGAYRDYMEAGERGLKTDDYNMALTQYLLANHIGIDDPESLLSLTHAYFAVAYYSSAAGYLRQAIRKFPEMPLTPLSPQSFFSTKRRYQQLLMKLERYTQAHSTEADSLLLLAYFRWFADSPAAARAALFDALQLAKNGQAKPETAEACRTFWDGMVASGKISGALEPAAQPTQPATRPASEKTR